MIYKNSEIPASFNKIAEISDNFVVWVADSRLSSSNSYEAYIQYFNPSFQYVYVDDYKITDGNKYVVDYDYVDNGYFNILDSSNIYFEKSSMVIDDSEITTNETSRADTINIFSGQLLCVVCTLWVFKQLSRLFFKGGLS